MPSGSRHAVPARYEGVPWGVAKAVAGSCCCVPVLLVAVLLGVALAASLTACGGSTGSQANASSPTPKQGGTYDYPLSVDPTFDPALTQWGVGGLAVLHEVQEGLVRYEEQPDGTLKTAPCLAESWSCATPTRRSGPSGCAAA